MLSKVIRHTRDPLYKNSFFIMLTSISNAGFGFVFWMLAAKLYPKEEVGVATALVSSMLLLSNMSRFGLGFSIIRFFPEKDKSGVLSTSIMVAALFAIVLGTIFVAGTELWSPELTLLRSPKNLIMYLIFLVASSTAILTGISFTAMRRADFYFLQGLIMGSRVFLLFPFVFLGAMGIFGAFSLSFVLASIVALFLLARLGVRFTPRIDKAFLNDALHFSAGNYIANLLMLSPNQLLPIMVLNVLGAENAAHYYIAFAIASLLFMIPQAVSTSLFVEGSHGELLKKATIKSLLAIAVLLTPSVAFLYLFGGEVLALIGKDYATSGFELLRIMVLASFFVAVCYVYFSIKRVQKDVKGIVSLSSLIFILLIGLSYVFMLEFGLVGIGYAWIVSYGIAAMVVGFIVKKESWI